MSAFRRNILSSASWLRDFSPEDRGSIFLRNFGICRWVYTVLKPMTSSSLTSVKISDIAKYKEVCKILFAKGREFWVVQIRGAVSRGLNFCFPQRTVLSRVCSFVLLLIIVAFSVKFTVSIWDILKFRVTWYQIGCIVVQADNWL